MGKLQFYEGSKRRIATPTKKKNALKTHLRSDTQSSLELLGWLGNHEFLNFSHGYALSALYAGLYGISEKI